MLLVDEPSLGFAPRMVAEISHVLGELKPRGAMMLLVERNALRALRLADRAYVLELGQITLAGIPRRSVCTAKAWRARTSGRDTGGP